MVPPSDVVTERSEEKVAELIEPMDLKIGIATKVDNDGVKVTRMGQ